MATDDDLPLNVAGNPYDPIFAGRIAALGGGSGAPAPRQPRKTGGGGWGGWLLAVIIGVNVIRGCANSTSSDHGRTFNPNNFRGGNPSPDHFPNPDLNQEGWEQLEPFRKGEQPPDDLGRDDQPGQAKPAGDGRGPDQEGP